MSMWDKEEWLLMNIKNITGRKSSNKSKKTKAKMIGLCRNTKKEWPKIEISQKNVNELIKHVQPQQFEIF